MSDSAAISGTLALGCVCCVLAGCSKEAGALNIAAATHTAGNVAVVASSVCDRQVLTVEDLAGILKAPITGTEPIPGDAQSCEFKTAGYPVITVSVRGGLGRSTVEAWASGKMPLPSNPLPGVGETAVWQEALREVIAQKNALLCDIQVRAGGGDLAIASSALPAALGALCNRIFAAS